jgi:hypothetical protein
MRNQPSARAGLRQQIIFAERQIAIEAFQALGCLNQKNFVSIEYSLLEVAKSPQ